MNSAEIRALQALRAPGGIDATQAGERWPANGTTALYALVNRGFAEKIDDTFFITEAGRAACPFRNPLAGKPATPPEVFSMPHGKQEITRQQVHAAIKAAGRDGIHRKALIKHFDCPESTMDNHLMWLNRAVPPVIFKPAKGVVCDIAFANETQHEAEVPAESGQNQAFTAEGINRMVALVNSSPAVFDEKPASTATDGWVRELLATDPESKFKKLLEELALATDKRDAAENRVIEQNRQIDALLIQLAEKPEAKSEGGLLELDDESITEIGVFSSGRLDIFYGEWNITLTKPVFAKLRAFLGLFQEAV